MTHKDFDLGPLANVTREIGQDTATLIFTRALRHPPEKVWRALTEPGEQLEWMPFVADRTLDEPGPVQLRHADGSNQTDFSPGEVLQSERARKLSYLWGDELFAWELTPQGRTTLLTLRHTTKTLDRLSMFAAGWHICIAVAERFMDGRPVGPIVGQKAMKFGWAELNDQYQEKLKVAS